MMRRLGDALESIWIVVLILWLAIQMAVAWAAERMQRAFREPRGK